jgi:lipopolysaccharide transport system ATP-binding protein
MSSPIIEVQGLCKSFIINHEQQEKYTALRDVVGNKAKKIFSFASSKKLQPAKETFWALNNVDFTVEQGDRLGIIGRNGAGKSTLLKILSRITEPTKGTVKIRGRVASLLEVGTGFHPELTGRENIFLNGAILGMSRTEIRKKFDEIVNFAEVEKFLDTPVKRYSSGMYVRLAFAVAAHLEPEILIVDEVLAVGDAQFQRKCLGKMEDVSQNEGRTVLFVSHQMRVIQSLCNKTLILNNGQVGFKGNLFDGLHYYESLIREHRMLHKNAGYQLSLSYSSNGVTNPQTIHSTDSIKFIVSVFSHQDVEGNYINICIDNTAGERIMQLRNDWAQYQVDLKKGENIFEIEIDRASLTAGVYDIWGRVVIGNEKIIIDTDYTALEIKGEHDAGYVAHAGQWSKIQ